MALSLSLGIPVIPVSHVTVWHYQVALDCNGPRGRQRQARTLGAPDTDWGTGPNQLWDYDVTWLATLERYVFLFLYSLLDHFSRKVVAWLVCETFTSVYPDPVGSRLAQRRPAGCSARPVARVTQRSGRPDARSLHAPVFREARHRPTFQPPAPAQR